MSTSDLTRAAKHYLLEAQRRDEETLRNAERLAAWKRRYHTATGRVPSNVNAGPLFSPAMTRDLLTRRICNAKAGNSTVVKFPRRKQQYMHANLPTGPEVA